jgi:non-heme chloroperoxidase
MGWIVLLCLWLPRVVCAQPAADLGSSTSMATDDGARIHCWVSGPKESALSSILFVPGYLMPAEIFEFQIRNFKKNRRVVAMDPRSQGNSTRVGFGHYPARRGRDIQAVMDQLQLTNVVLVGWSLAASEILSLCEQNPPKGARALALIDGDLSYQVSKEESAGEISFLKYAASSMRANRLAGLRAFVQSLYSKPPPAEHLERVVQAVQSTTEDTGLALLVGRIGFQARLDQINLPTLIVLSGKNPKREKIALEAKQLKSAEIHVFEDAGHALFVDQVEKFNSLLESFLARIEQQRQPGSHHLPPRGRVHRASAPTKVRSPRGS